MNGQVASALLDAIEAIRGDLDDFRREWRELMDDSGLKRPRKKKKQLRNGKRCEDDDGGHSSGTDQEP